MDPPDAIPDAMDEEFDYPETQEQRQLTPPPPEERNPNLWGFLETEEGCPSIPKPRYDLFRAQPEVTIGRNPESTIRIRHANSLNHATIRWDGVKNGASQVVITDHGSKNKTFVDGSRVRPGMPRKLVHMAEISFGSPQPPPPGNTDTPDFRFTFHDLASSIREVKEHYVFGEILGAGTFGTVYKAHDRDGRVFAVKAIKGGMGRDDWNSHGGSTTPHQVMARREIEIMRALEHPNICRLHDHFWNRDESIDLVLEFIDGGDLMKLIVDYRGLSERMTKHVMRQVCNALAFMHSKNITHRDLKPENILVTAARPPVVKIADFGLAKLIDPARLASMSICGTPIFAAPELIQHVHGRKGYNQGVDCYAAGLILCICLCSMIDTLYGLMPDGVYGWKHAPNGPIVDWAELEKSVGKDREGYPVYFSTRALYFVRRLLETDPKTRMTMAEACAHPWFEFDRADAYGADACEDLTSSMEGVSMRTLRADANAALEPQSEDDNTSLAVNGGGSSAGSIVHRHATLMPTQSAPTIMNAAMPIDTPRPVLLARGNTMTPRATQGAAQVQRAVGAGRGMNKRKHEGSEDSGSDTDTDAGTVRGPPLRPSSLKGNRESADREEDKMDISPKKQRR
ncbi:kinase-like domain-containing protein [Mycena belliarum]|uniref:Kinase-like domain-containing protein n=1 Tax=Mycena belliarum TaxID=1033014 RepID=A0AAD6U5Y2_9AGAR|nr:kinase-like domain-containing protein [Mycena belliae]